MRKTRKFLAEVDALESRTVLSTAHPASHAVALRGSGTLATTGTMQVTGGVQATVALEGTLDGLGKSSGKLNISVTTRSHKFQASGVITTADGDKIAIRFSGVDQRTRPHQTKAVGVFHFDVTGGTGAFGRATGGGTIRVTQELATGKETFTVNGKVRG